MTALPCAPEPSARARREFPHEHRWGPPHSYLRPAPRVRLLKHLADFLRDTEVIIPGGRTPSPISCVLRTFGHVARGFSPRAALYVEKSPSPVVATRFLARFLGAENTSSPLPLNVGYSRFGTVSECPHPEALCAPLKSWLSFLPWPFLGPSPKGVTPPVARVATHELPTWAALNEPDGTFTRFAAVAALVRTPRAGLAENFRRHPL